MAPKSRHPGWSNLRASPEDDTRATDRTVGVNANVDELRRDSRATHGQRLAGKIALITGASRGIGAAVARKFAAEGARTILVARTVLALTALECEIRSAHGEAMAPIVIPCDLAAPSELQQLGPAVMDRVGRLDILVGNAGYIGRLGSLTSDDTENWDDVFAVNLTANLRLIRMFQKPLLEAPAGRAIFVTSRAALYPNAKWGAYSASKAALDAMVLAWADEVRHTRLRVNLLGPGATRTTMRAIAHPDEDPSRLKTPEAVAGAFVDLAVPSCEQHGEIVRIG